MGLDTKIYWLTDHQSQCGFDFDFDLFEVSFQELGRGLGMAVEGDFEEMASKESGCEPKTSCVIWSCSGTVINPLPGYD
jgi:hypothetical protein